MTDSQATTNNSQSSENNKNRISGSIRVSSRQKGNPVLKHIRKVPWEFEDGLVADYILGSSCVALYLSVRSSLIMKDDFKYYLLYYQIFHSPTRLYP